MSEFKEVMQSEFGDRGLSETEAGLAADGLSKLKNNQEPTAEEVGALKKTIPTPSESIAIIEQAKQLAQSQDAGTGAATPVQP